MANHSPLCKKCHHPADDQDITTQSIHYTATGTVEAHLLCNWCGHTWTRESPTLDKLNLRKTRKYDEAVKNATHADTIISIIHR